MALTFAYRTINTLIFYNNTPTEPFLHSIVLFITYYFNFIANLVILHWKCTVLSMCTKNAIQYLDTLALACKNWLTFPWSFISL